MVHKDERLWIKITADAGYVANIQKSHIEAPSLLCALAELDGAHDEGGTPKVQLDCSADVAREVVDVLRLGSSYTPPADTRLLKAVQHQLDYLCITAPSRLQSLSFPEAQEVVLLPSYMSQHSHADSIAGLLMYSRAANGWSNRIGCLDPRPKGLFQLDAQDGSRGNKMMSAVLRAETTGVGEDIVCMVPNYLPVSYGSQAVWMTSSLQCGSFPAPPRHTEGHLYDSAMVAAAGNLYLLGGASIGWPAPALTYCPFEVFDPHIGSWFESSPLPGQVQLSGHSLVTNNTHEGMLLALGGWGEVQNEASSYQFMSDSIFMYDIRAQSWSANPSGCRWRRAATADSMSAVTLGDCKVMILSTDASNSSTAHVDILDLRKWEFLEGAKLERQSGCLQSVGLVVCGGKVLAIGGASRGFAGGASREVHEYQYHDSTPAGSWKQLPQLPFGVRDASPVVVRMHCTRSAMRQPIRDW